MAPNRKQVSQLLSSSPVDFTSLQATVQPKFLPLTHPKEEQQHLERQQEQEKVVAQQQEASASYWDWPADVPKDLFSASHLESNLVKASEEIKEDTSNTNADNDDYWAEESSSSEQPVVTKPQHVVVNVASYWDWPTTTEKEEKQATIDAIVEEDKARRFVSASLKNVQPSNNDPQQTTTHASNDGYWAWESPVMASHTSDFTHPQANYWDWETPSDDKETVMKNSMIAELQAYEHARQLLSSEHIVKLLQQQQQSTESVTATTPSAMSDDYWTWSEPLGDAYWDETPKAAVACGGAGYWDW